MAAFEIGFVLAGAVSAGAYSAGVMDFVYEALDAYDAAKRDPAWTGPRHDVYIPVMAGASAGGMTAAIAALHAFHDLKHVWPTRPVPPKTANRFYSSWVEDIDIAPLLDLDDLPQGGAQRVTSLLCSSILDRILKDAFDLQGGPRQ